MTHERLRPQFLFDKEKINQFKQIAECIEDGKINAFGLFRPGMIEQL